MPPTHETLENNIIQLDAQRLSISQWMFNHIRPFLKGKILELGSSYGQLGELITNAGFELRLSDPKSQFCWDLKTKFEGNSNVKGIHKIIPSSRAFESEYYRYLGRFNTVMVLNSIKGIPDDLVALENIKKLLAHKGILILQIPAITALYNELDAGVETWKKQNLTFAKEIFGKTFDIVMIQFFNVIKNEEEVINNIYRQEVMTFSFMDQTIIHRNGLSALVVGLTKNIGLIK